MATPKKRKPQRAGRKTLYNAERCHQARRLLLVGYTQAEIAEFWGITPDTLSRWKKTHPEFNRVISSTLEEANGGVAASLLDRALGNCVITEEKPMVVNGVVETHSTVKQLPADIAAAKYWLNNRGDGKWSDKISTELTGADGGPINMNLQVEFVTAEVSDED